MLHKLDFRGWEKNTAWCVPTAISLLTGVPLIHAHSRAAFIQNKGLKDVEGVYTEESLLLLREQGYKTIAIDMTSRWFIAPTIRRFLNERTAYEKVMPLLIGIDGHVITAHFDYAADNWTRKPVKIEDFPKLGRKVYSAFIVMKDIA